MHLASPSMGNLISQLINELKLIESDSRDDNILILEAQPKVKSLVAHLIAQLDLFIYEINQELEKRTGIFGPPVLAFPYTTGINEYNDVWIPQFNFAEGRDILNKMPYTIAPITALAGHPELQLLKELGEEPMYNLLSMRRNDTDGWDGSVGPRTKVLTANAINAFPILDFVHRITEIIFQLSMTIDANIGSPDSEGNF